MATYSIIEEKKPAIIRASIKRLVLLCSIGIFAGTGIVLVPMILAGKNSLLYIFIIYLAALILAGIAAFIGARKGLKRYRENLNIQYRIDSGHFSIVRDGNAITDFTHGDIKKINRYKDGSIEIFLNKNPGRIIIRNYIEKYDEMISEINGIFPITDTGKKQNPVLTIAATVLMLSLLCTFYLASNRYLMLAAGSLLILGLLVCFIEIVTNKMVDKKTKRTSLVIFLMILVIITRMFNLI